MSAVQKHGETSQTNKSNISSKKTQKRVVRKRVPNQEKKEEQKDVQMEGAEGYDKSWSVVQRAVDTLMTETTVPVPATTIKNREPRHLPKRRVFVSLYKDVLLNNLILKTQKFQLEYEKEGAPFHRQVIIDYPTEQQKPRKERHYEFWPFFEQLPNLDKEEQIVPEDIKEEEVHDTLGFTSDSSIELAEECKENSTFLPAPLSDEITREIAGLFDAAKPPKPAVSFVNKYMKKGPFAKIF